VICIALKSETSDAGRLYAPDAAVYGLARGRIAVCFAENMAALLWAAEEAARDPSMAAVIIDAPKPHRLLNLTATRRIQLAAEMSGATPILMRGANDAEPTSACRRFRVSAAASGPLPYDPSAPGPPRWRVEIERCRLGKRGAWVVEWDYASRELREALPVPLPLSAAMADRSLQTIEAIA
jgi:protein ImuA